MTLRFGCWKRGLGPLAPAAGGVFVGRMQRSTGDWRPSPGTAAPPLDLPPAGGGFFGPSPDATEVAFAPAGEGGLGAAGPGEGVACFGVWVHPHPARRDEGCLRDAARLASPSFDKLRMSGRG